MGMAQRLSPDRTGGSATHLNINETFGPTIQGEGPSTGRLCSFLRLAGCNLDCGRGEGATWACDTPYSWDWQRFDHRAEATRVQTTEVARTIPSAPMLVVSGGEPLLQRSALAAALPSLRMRGFRRIEVETNGTVDPQGLKVDQFNVSVKLANSGVSCDRRLHPEVIHALRVTGRAVWKFVAAEPGDLAEVEQLASGFGLAPVWVMPAGEDPDTMLASAQRIANDVVRHGWNLTLRSHLLLWGKARGH